MPKYKFPLRNPSPNFKNFKEVLEGKTKPEKVHFVEIFIDEEIMKFITENMMGKKWVSRSEKNNKIYWRQYINFYYSMGYDYVPIIPADELKNLPLEARKADDTALLSKGERRWANEGKGIITSWENFEKFPWEKIKLRMETYEYLNENLPEGMKLTFMDAGGLYEFVLEFLLGYEGFFYLLYDQPDLVKAVFNRWGKIIYKIYETIVSMENVGAIFHGDDLGYKTGTMVKPNVLRELIFPWFKKYVFLAHKYGKMYWYHCCGNISEIMEDLIEEIRIDALHSFEDVCCPVTEYKKDMEIGSVS